MIIARGCLSGSLRPKKEMIGLIYHPEKLSLSCNMWPNFGASVPFRYGTDLSFQPITARAMIRIGWPGEHGGDERPP